MPARFHFSQSDRIAPLWLIPEAGWAILQRKDFDIPAAKAAGQEYTLHGLHGYDHEHPLMRAIFIARGPAFPHAPHSEVPVFQNIEVYNIVCDSLGIEGRPNNGTLRLPLKPVGIHGEGPAADGDGHSDGKIPPSGGGEQQGGENDETKTGDLGFFKSVLEKLKETVHKITSIFHSAEEAAAEAKEGDPN
jgi:hypothetical protein